MGLQITLTPQLEDNGNGTPTTQLGIQIDISSIREGLERYDLLLKTTLKVGINSKQANIYEYAKIYKDIKTDTIEFETVVLGVVEIQDIECEARGIFVDK